MRATLPLLKITDIPVTRRGALSAGFLLRLKTATSGLLLLSAASSALAVELDLSSVSLGMGVRASYSHREAAEEEIDDFAVDSARAYINAKVSDITGVMVNAAYRAGDEQIRIIDALVQFSLSEQFNVWIGRFLPPSDRANLYGSYYGDNWAVFRDGVQGAYPSEIAGRDDGLMYWGQFGIAKVSAGVFDLQPLTKGDSALLYAARVQLNFWDAELGYYLSGTYYGAKDVLAIGVAAQTARGDGAYSADFLLEKKLGSGSVVTIEGQYLKDEGLGAAASSIEQRPETKDGYYMLAAFLFPKEIGLGKFQALVKYGEMNYESAALRADEQRTAELNVNYLIPGSKTRVSLYYLDSNFDLDTRADFHEIGLGVQVRI